jgi:hypothetical protein
LIVCVEFLCEKGIEGRLEAVTLAAIAFADEATGMVSLVGKAPLARIPFIVYARRHVLANECFTVACR